MFIKKFVECSERSGDIFFKAGENVTEVNFVIKLPFLLKCQSE